MSSTREKVRLFQSQFNGNSKVLVIINADPDSISSAMAVKRLLWRKVAEVTIAHFNRVTRPDNLTMIQLTDSTVTRLEDIDKTDYDKFVIVDSQPDHNVCFSGVDYDAIIDHHPVTDDKAAYVDIR
ncbi:MAG: phosphoesterase, partial [Desulfobacterales bacterium]|nr:phosphoesterase [Desulfobacterales bacterium]